MFLLLAICTGAMAQFHAGMTTAYSATYVLDKGLSKDPRYNSTMTYNWAPIGLSAGLNIGKKIGLSLEGILSKQGQVYQMLDVAKKVAGERRIDLEYINIPMLLKFMGKGDGKVRGNFNFGPQLSLITKAVESVQANAGEFKIPSGLTIDDIKKDFPTAVPSVGGYTLSSPVPSKELLSRRANDFKNAEFQIAMAFGLDLDLSEHLYLTTQIRANYSLTDMRNGDVLNSLKAGNVGDVFGGRANMIVGVQLGLHYYFGVLRSFKE